MKSKLEPRLNLSYVDGNRHKSFKLNSLDTIFVRQNCFKLLSEDTANKVIARKYNNIIEAWNFYKFWRYNIRVLTLQIFYSFFFRSATSEPRNQ